jgi:hypothetical protein
MENENEEISVLDELFINSEHYHSSVEFFNLLKFIKRFPKLSPFNAFLIQMQNNGAKLVLTPKGWKFHNRAVKRNARPMVILIPFGPVSFVYDIEDTIGDPVPDEVLHPFKTTGLVDSKIFYNTILNMAQESIGYFEENMHKNSAGSASRVDGKLRITVNSNYGLNERYSTIVHELGHIFCGHLEVNNGAWWPSRMGYKTDQVEIEAESVAYLVCKRLGLKTTSNSYLASYIRKDKEMPKISLNTILTVSNYIEQMGKAGFKSKSKKTISISI